MKGYRLPVILLVIGIMIIASPRILQIVNNYIQKSEVSEFKKSVENFTEDEIEVLMDRAEICNEEVFYGDDGFRDPWGDNQDKLVSFNKCLAEERDFSFNFDEDMFGALEIPKLKLVIPIYLGSSHEVLNKGVGQVEGSSLPLGGESTHTVLSAHRGMWTKTMFRSIDNLHDGDQFLIHTLKGSLTYEVYRQKVIYPDQTEFLEIEENKDLATLLTCHPYGFNHQRLLIQAERIDDD